ncbi:MAG: hypothetical protein MI725_15985 [Pirellulales bacterium]|nr:hypothetical protein [Pirellulales bacterium]
MKTMFATLGLLSLALVVFLGCSDTPSAAPVTKALYQSATLCGDCGQIKGAAACCAEGAATCAGCNLHKGAPGCCKMEVGSEVTLCGGCGEIKGAEACCAEGAEACADCGLHKGAPGCCKLEKIAADTDDAPKLEEEDEKDGSDKKVAGCGECEDHDHEDDDDDEIV